MMSDQKLDAVLPLTLKDIDRFKILQKSLDTFCLDLLKQIWVVVPDSEISEIKKQINSEKYRIIKQSFLIPHCKVYKVKGWYIQQLIKLAIAQYIQSDFYLTLDADVICTQKVSFSDLIKDGRAVFYANNDVDINETKCWGLNVLMLNSNFSPRYTYYNVTPTILSKNAVLKMQSYMENLARSELSSKSIINYSKRQKMFLKVFKLLNVFSTEKSFLKQIIVDYRSYLIRNIPWTEYTLYYNFCDAQNILDQYHILRSNCIYAGQESVWTEDSSLNWKPEPCFEGERSFFFIVLQSTAKMSTDLIQSKINKYFR